MAAVPESTYLIVFPPDPDGAAGKYHRLKVRLVGKSGDYVQARPGYVIPAAADVTAAGGPSDRSRGNGLGFAGQFPMTLTGQVKTGQPGGALLTLVIHVDLSQLQFDRLATGTRRSRTFIGSLLDAGGKMVAAREGAMDFALTDATLARLKASGVNARLALNAPPGAYKLRVVATDSDGKLAAQNQAVDIH